MTSTFSRIALWGQMTDASVARPARQIIEHLRSRAITILVAPEVCDLPEFADCLAIADKELSDQLDLLISIGGDGTMLGAARRVAGATVPILGVNLGRLGFLTDILPEQMTSAIDAVLSGDYLEENRLLLRSVIRSGKDGSKSSEHFAFNDVVLQKGVSGRMFDFNTVIGGTFVNKHSGDGIIVATPTGSTAYALSCGGPIVEPSVEALVMVPICPHSLSDRPLVVPSTSEIEISLADADEAPAHVTCDGEEIGQLAPKQTLIISVANETVTLLHPTNHSYYELLRSKLNWGKASRSGARERSS